MSMRRCSGIRPCFRKKKNNKYVIKLDIYNIFVFCICGKDYMSIGAPSLKILRQNSLGTEQRPAASEQSCLRNFRDCPGEYLKAFLRYMAKVAHM